MRALRKKICLLLVLVLALSFCRPASVFAEGTPESPELLVFGSWDYGYFTDDYTEEKHTYQFTLPESGRVVIKVQTSTGNEIHYSGPGGLGGYVEPDTEVSGEVELVKGDYTITVKEESKSNTGEYGIFVDFTPAHETYQEKHTTYDDVKESVSVPFAKKITGHFAVSESQELYKFRITESGRFYVVAGSMPRVQFWILDKNGAQIAYTGYNPNVGDSKTQIVTDLVPGTYYLQINDLPISTSRTSPYYRGVYTFTPKFKPSGETYTYKNDSIKQVKSKDALTLCKTVKGQLALNDEADYFKIYIPKTGNYNLTVTADSRYGSYTFPLESLQNASGTPQSYSYYSMDKADPPVRTYYYKNLAKGTYYIHFAKGNATGPYSFIMRPAPVENYKPVAGSKSLTAKWVKGTGTGYQVQIALDNKFTTGKKTSTITSVSTVKKVFKNLKAKKRYYVRVRSYVKYNDVAYYSVWSKRTYITTKS